MRRHDFAFLIAFCSVFVAESVARAWNNLGHKIVADIAWEELDEATREKIVATLRQNPQIAEAGAKRRGETVEDEDRWIFQQAAIATDQTSEHRDGDLPNWRYIRFPVFIGPERPVAFNLELKGGADYSQWNIAQAIEFARYILTEPYTQPGEKSGAYCMLIQLIADVHQPLHTATLVSDRFPEGDRGGHAIPVVPGENLYSLWENLLATQDEMKDVAQAVAELRRDAKLWDVDVDTDVKDWIEESRSVATSFAYSPEILAAVAEPGDLEPIDLSEAYLREAKEHARRRVVAAGLRLAKAIKSLRMSGASKP